MKRIALISIIAGIMVLATACGGSAPVATQAPAQPAATEVPAQQSAAAESPATTDAVSASGSQVDITLTDNKIEASMTEFKVGVPYTFVITNAGRHAHNFNINTPVSKAGSLENALSTALLAVGQSQLGSGTNVTVEYTFPDSAAGALLEFSCLIRRHYEDGMLLPITVSK